MGVKIELLEVGAYFLQNEIPLFLEKVPLAKRMHMVFKHDKAPAHYSHLGDTSSTLNIPRTMYRPWWSHSVATKVPRPCSFRFLSVGMDEKRSLQRKSKHKTRIVLLKQERQDDLRRATHTIVKRVEKCTEVDGGIFEHLL
jgi:hypothetical protein